MKATEGYFVMRENGRVESFQPHMHLRGKAMSMEAILPNGQIAGAEPRGRLQLQLAQHLRLRRQRGAAAAEGHDPEDHRLARQHGRQKANPDPNVWVGYGDRTVDEMAHAWVNVTYMNDADYRAEVKARREALGLTTTRTAAVVRQIRRACASSRPHDRVAVVGGHGHARPSVLVARQTAPGADASAGRPARAARPGRRSRFSRRSKAGGRPRTAQVLLLGYFNRNKEQALDIPIGPDNRIEPGGPDFGQPTHFHTGRQYGVFAIPIPKDFGTKRLTWTIVANGHTSTVSFWTNPPYWIDFYKNLANGNEPPVIKFADAGPEFIGPPRERFVQTLTGVGRSAADADALGAGISRRRSMSSRSLACRTGGCAAADRAAAGHVRQRAAAGDHRRACLPRRARADRPTRRAAARAAERRGDIRVIWKKYRGPGDVKIADEAIALVNDGDAKKFVEATTTATFSAPGEYWLRASDQRQLRRRRRRRSVLLDDGARRRQRQVVGPEPNSNKRSGGHRENMSGSPVLL